MSHETIGCRGNTITLSGGDYFDFAEGGHSPIRITDISAGLATECRFGGQLRRDSRGSVRFYSVAQHSVIVARIVEEADPAQAFAALMYDASEGYHGDMMKPLKIMLPDFQAVAKRVELQIATVFGLPHKMSPVIKHADLRALRTEQRDLMHPGNARDTWTGLDAYEPLPNVIRALQPADADLLFLNEFCRLAPLAVVLNQGLEPIGDLTRPY